MRHTSVKMNSPIEFVNVEPLKFSPFISKCQIKVCYVGDEPNRNGSIITKEVATEMALSLRGAPIVGFYNTQKEDFEGHEADISIKDGQIVFQDTTKPYGFVDLNAKIWFQKFLDDGEVEREYLMTEGYIWTEQFPEAKRIFESGNNQSMELDAEKTSGSWTKDGNGDCEFFIINETIISKLCILGEDVEPCFEGASVEKPIIQFSLGEDLKNKIYTLMEQMNKILQEGGDTSMENQEVVVNTEALTPEVMEDLKNIQDWPVVIEKDGEEIPVDMGETVETETSENEEKVEEVVEVTEEVATYSLEDIPEYTELNTKFSELEAKYSELEKKYNAIVAEKAQMDETLASLTEFKANIVREEKQKMIDSFYMLSDEDKKDVVENIDKYSVEDIEAKLSVICVRNKVSFNSEDEKDEPTTYSFSGSDEAASVPEWVKAALEVSKSMI